MGAQRGKDLLLKIAGPTPGVFVTVAGLRARQIAFNADAVDVTNAESGGRWRELLAGAGVRRASLSGTGVFLDDDSDGLVREAFFAGDIRTWRIVIPQLGVIDGPFQITAMEYRGEHAGEVTFDIAMESAGALAFSPG